MRARLGLAILTTLVLAGPAISRPYDSAPDVVYRAPRVQEDYGQAIVRGLDRNVAPVSPNLAPSRPWDNLGDFCMIEARTRRDAVGTFFALSVRPPPVQTNAPRGLAVAQAEALAMAALDRAIAVQLDRLQRNFPPDDQARFLGPGQRLGTRPATWGQAAAQRAEWAVALHVLADVFRGRAAASPEFDANYTAVLWSALECDLLAGHARFLAGLDAGGETITDPRQTSAVTFLRGFVQPPPR